MAKAAIGFITHEKAAKYLPYFLDSLKKQSFSDYKIFAIDNNEVKKNESADLIKSRYPEIEYEWAGKNLGFGKAHNILIKKSINSGCDYYVSLNPDMLLSENAIEFLIKALEKNPDAGSAAPKILKWDFAGDKKTDYIDTVGIMLKTGLRFKDLGQGVKDLGQFDKASILGPSGAAGIFRLRALEKIENEHGFYDESIFMYKEDCDVAYRLKLAGFKAILASNAIIYHDRTAKVIKKGILTFFATRSGKSDQVKKWSFFSQNYIYRKYWRKENSFSKCLILFRAAVMFVYVLLFERYLLEEYKKAFDKS